MNRFIATIFLSLALLPAVASAQEESPSKRINSIKRNGAYLYAEATAETQDKATDAANALLLVEISEYVASKKKLANAEQVICKDIKAELQTITMDRGEMKRVFIYIKKSDVEPAENVAIVTKETIAAVASKDADLPANGTTPAQQGSESQNPERGTSAKVDFGDARLSDWQKKLVEEIARQTTMQKFKMALNKYKAQYRVKRLGSKEQDCPTPNAAFYAFFDAGGNLTALLCPAEANSRINCLTGGNAALSDFGPNNFVWFVLSK